MNAKQLQENTAAAAAQLEELRRRRDRAEAQLAEMETNLGRMMLEAKDVDAVFAGFSERRQELEGMKIAVAAAEKELDARRAALQAVQDEEMLEEATRKLADLRAAYADTAAMMDAVDDYAARATALRLELAQLYTQAPKLQPEKWNSVRGNMRAFMFQESYVLSAVSTLKDAAR